MVLFSSLNRWCCRRSWGRNDRFRSDWRRNGRGRRCNGFRRSRRNDRFRRGDRCRGRSWRGCWSRSASWRRHCRLWRFKRVLQSFACFKLRNNHRRNLDLLGRRLRVHAHACRSRLGHERTESRDVNFAARLQCRGDEIDERFDRILGLFFAQPNPFGKLVNEFRLIHK